MSHEYTFPPAVVLGLWLNAARSGAVSPTDAANAIESITQQIGIAKGGSNSDVETSSWLELVRVAQKTNEPAVAALPVDGDQTGIPAGVLARIMRSSGVVAIGPSLLLCEQSDGFWILVSEPHKVFYYDLNQTRRSLTEEIATATDRLSASDLFGDESEILDALEAFHALHLPPHLSKRSKDALELAARVIIVADGAKASATALHSPSIDRQKVQVLQKLIAQSRAVLQSVVMS
jgi:hypothetical protein